MAQVAHLPGPLRLLPAYAFAGRARELAQLRALLPRTVGEGRRAALVAGEPGSGKSRLVRELSAALAEEGTTVLYGDCDAVVGSPYAPFATALTELVRAGGVTPPVLDGLGSSTVDLARLVPELDMRPARSKRRSSSDADAERLRLHTAVTELLVGVSTESPVLLVLEDLHWADSSTLLLVRHLVRSGAAARMLIVATFRDTEADVAAELSEALVDVYRTEGVVRIRLGGLADGELAEFIRLASGAEPTTELTETVRDLTGGNAFLVTELWRELVDEDAVSVGVTGVRLVRPASELGTPATVREVANQRLQRLSPSTIGLLELAAVAGADFELATIRHAEVLEEGALLDAIDEAVHAGLIVERPGRGLAYRFTHELVRRAVVGRLSASRTAELHLRVARSLERDDANPLRTAELAALAYHYAAAAPLGDLGRAVEVNLLAAESAMSALAFDEASRRFRAALELGLENPAERADVLLRLGDARHRAGDAEEALHAFREAAAIARELPDDELLARAAIGFEETCWRPAIHDAGARPLLEEAARALPADDSPLRARVIGGLARALTLLGDTDGGAQAREASIAMSRRLGDKPSLSETLAAAFWSRGPRTNEQVNEMLLESYALARELDDLDLAGDALAWLVPSAVALCDHDAARDRLDEAAETARLLSEPFLLHVTEQYRSALELCDGHLDAAESAAMRSREWGRHLTGRDASGVYGIQMFGLRREQGRLADLAPVVRLLGGSARDSAWRPGFIAVLAELGMVVEARRELDRLLEDGIGALRPSLWTAALLYLTDACAMLRDESLAETLHRELVPHAGSNTMVGHLVACYGATDRYLGMNATVVGEWEQAEEYFEAALALNARLGARTWLAHTAYEYGRMLLVRDADGDRQRARTQLGVAVGLARTIGMPTLLARIDELRAGVEPASALPDGLSRRELEILTELARGRSNREIGRLLHISEHTAANHVRSILRKTESANRTEAAAYAHRRGLVRD
jgi:DNA-binding CsgD family transcriptional regulator/Mrp family chromosome partitioning ATPase